jgi:hypothetical protein
MSHKEVSPARQPGQRSTPPGDLPINSDEQPAGHESGPLRSADEQRKREHQKLVPPPQPEDNDV